MCPLGDQEGIVTDPPHLWTRTQMISESIEASRRVLAQSEAIVRRARASVTRADALLKRIHKLCAPYPVLMPLPPSFVTGATSVPAAPQNADEELEFSAIEGR